jgi:hypothetical protein
MNTRAQSGNIILFVGLLAVLIVIGVGITAGVAVFFGQENDFREVDANALHEKVKTCLYEKTPELTSPIPGELGKDFFEQCKINEQVVKDNLLIIIHAPNGKTYEQGRGDETQCNLSSKNQYFPICVKSTLSKKILTNDGRSDATVDYIIITGSSQNSREKTA